MGLGGNPQGVAIEAYYMNKDATILKDFSLLSRLLGRKSPYY